MRDRVAERANRVTSEGSPHVAVTWVARAVVRAHGKGHGCLVRVAGEEMRATSRLAFLSLMSWSGAA